MTPPKNVHASLCKPLPWLEAFTVGSKHIDDEHRAMIEACNDLCVMAGSAPACVLKERVMELVASIERHFASEEALFPQVRFPTTAQHQHLSEHENIRRRLADLMPASGDSAALVERTVAIRTMLVEHILRHDMGLKTWIQHADGM